jgi:hypothetical protein
MIRLLSILGSIYNLKKPKVKYKGKKLYKNTHGSMYRVVPNYKHRRMTQHRKMLRKLEAQIKQLNFSVK